MRKSGFLFLILLAAASLQDAAAAQLPAHRTAAPATFLFPVLPYEAADDTAPQLLPVTANHALGGDHAGITRAIVVIHDLSRDAGGALATLSSLAGANNETTIILAPQFLINSDVPSNADEDLARWPLGGWEGGGESLAPAPQKGVSSFTALDLLLLYLGEKEFFPDLKTIVIAGHGAGGDFVQRYAATGKAPDLLEKQGVATRFVAADASSYLYFTTLRPIAGKPGFALPDKSKCAAYDSYWYGLDSLNEYAQHAGASAIRLRYIERHIVYLAGEKVAENDPLPDVSCAARLEGPDRLARAMNYDIYLNTIFGESAAATQKFATVPRVGYDPAAIFGSDCGMDALFGDGECAAKPLIGK